MFLHKFVNRFAIYCILFNNRLLDVKNETQFILFDFVGDVFIVLAKQPFLYPNYFYDRNTCFTWSAKCIYKHTKHQVQLLVLLYYGITTHAEMLLWFYIIASRYYNVWEFGESFVTQ